LLTCNFDRFPEAFFCFRLDGMRRFDARTSEEQLSLESVQFRLDVSLARSFGDREPFYYGIQPFLKASCRSVGIRQETKIPGSEQDRLGGKLSIQTCAQLGNALSVCPC